MSNKQIGCMYQSFTVSECAAAYTKQHTGVIPVISLPYNLHNGHNLLQNGHSMKAGGGGWETERDRDKEGGGGAQFGFLSPTDKQEMFVEAVRQSYKIGLKPKISCVFLSPLGFSDWLCIRNSTHTSRYLGQNALNFVVFVNVVYLRQTFAASNSTFSSIFVLTVFFPWTVPASVLHLV